MSLINEALKKAQDQRAQQQARPPAPPGGEPPPHQHSQSQPGKGHRKSFLWGFVMAVFVVGTFSILLATFFVYQILPRDDPKEATVEPGDIPAETVERAEPSASDQPATIPGLEEPAEEIEPVVAAAAPETPAAPVPAPSDQPAPEESVSQQREVSPPQSPAPPQPPNPDVIARLRELEIRGTLGGSKVLILDQATGKTRAYRAGDTLEGSMGLVVEDIAPTSIKLKDYAGYIHTKSF